MNKSQSSSIQSDANLSMRNSVENNHDPSNRYPRSSAEINYSGPISVPMQDESAAIQAAPAYDMAAAKKYIPFMPEIRSLLDTLADNEGLISFGSEKPSRAAFEKLNEEIRKLSADAHKVSLLMMDLKTRSGAAYHSSVPMCTQSTIKAIYVGALIEFRPESLVENGQYMHDAVVYSSNEAYENLREIYGDFPIKKWCEETGVDTGFAEINYPRTYTARDMFKMWTRLYCFLNGNDDRTNFAAYYADSIASATGKQITDPHQTKAGWESGVGEDRVFDLSEIPEQFRDGDPANDECAINDTGIVYTQNGPYIFVIYTDHPFAAAVNEDLMPNPLNDLVKALYQVQNSIAVNHSAEDYDSNHILH